MFDLEERCFHRYPNMESRLGNDESRKSLIESAESLGIVLPDQAISVLTRYHGMQILNVLETGIDRDPLARWARIANMRVIGFYSHPGPTNTFEKLMAAVKEYLPGMFPFAIVGPFERPVYCLSCRDHDRGAVFRKVPSAAKDTTVAEELFESWAPSLDAFLSSLRTFNYDDRVSDYLCDHPDLKSINELPEELLALPWKEPLPNC